MKKEEKKQKSTEAYEWEFGREWFEDLQKKAAYNVFQSEYYERMAEDYNDDSYRKKAKYTLECSKIWNLNHYVIHGVKQIQSIVRCNDAFCYVCQSLKAQRRFEIYSPVLKELEGENDIYHIVFTVPNVTGPRLKWTLDKMYDRFGRLMEYFRGTKKIKGIDFGQYGYRGAVRSLEITTGKRKTNYGNDFHPHFHCMFVLTKDPPNTEKVIENSFSLGKYDFQTGKHTVTYFSRFEWLLQRVWCLLMLDIKVTKENIVNIYEVTDGAYKDGFDVKADDAKGKYHEIFKYVVKGTYKKEKIYGDTNVTSSGSRTDNSRRQSVNMNSSRSGDTNVTSSSSRTDNSRRQSVNMNNSRSGDTNVTSSSSRTDNSRRQSVNI